MCSWRKFKTQLKKFVTQINNKEKYYPTNIFSNKKLIEPKMEEIGIIIEARMGSTRFPGKVMKKINGKPMLYYLLKRLSKLEDNIKIIVATSLKSENKIISDFSKNMGVYCYRGSENNVLLRVLSAAEKFKLKNIISITADCPIICIDILRDIIRKYKKSKVDYISTKNFIGGMDTQIYRKNL